MKKLTFALACASAVAAFAAAEDSAVISSINFDNYTADFKGLSLKDDSGNSGAVTASYWLYEGTEDGSTVKAYNPAITGNANYLELSTEGGTLWRSINNLATSDSEESGATLGAAQEVTADGLYIDTLVQFTATEDGGAPETAEGDKLAIWLDKTGTEESPVYTLKVKGAFLTAVTEGRVSTPATEVKDKVYALSGVDILPGTWHRLTVTVVKNLFDTTVAKNCFMSGFIVKIDGQVLAIASGDAAGDDKFAKMPANWFAQGMKTAFDAGQFIPSMVGFKDSDVSALQAVGFKGSGALDSLQFTTQDPNKGSADVVPVTGVSLDKSSATLTVGETLTLNATVAPENASDTTVTWSVTDGGVVTVDGGVVTAVKAGTATVTVTTKDGSKTATCTVTVNPIAVTATVTLSPTTAEWAADLKLPTPTVTGAPEGATSNGAWDGSIPDANPTVPVTLTYTVTFTGNYSGTASATFTVTPQNKKYPTYISKDNQEAYDAWVSKYSVGDREDSTEALLDAFLLNVAPAEAEAEAGKFTITSITIDATGKVTVVAPAKNSKGDAFNGTVEVKGAATVDAAKYELKTTDPTARFFKAFLSLPAAE